MHPDNFRQLSEYDWIVYLRPTAEVIFNRFKAKGIPAYLEDDPTLENLSRIYKQRDGIYKELASYIIDTSNLSVDEAARQVIKIGGLKKLSKIRTN